ncbi:hypothetical protein [Streptomyces sp. 4R-3d]|uniref:hypothetical protein n=1 Tax=Streptomyces sp. 4R-3d TaxID=2559605 RepID=UPI001072E14A|nr:hypothetical protein [Streptomyces sp. 4R-3d]TFI30150.1 hypothetical protein E4P36_05210 [Streptomyces sp. 4R-3d]
MTDLAPAARLARIRAAVDARPTPLDDDYELLLGEIERLHRRVAELEAAQPSRLSATPVQVDAFLRTILAEDTYLSFQQVIGSAVASGAARDLMAKGVALGDESQFGAGMCWAASGIDPATGGGPAPLGPDRVHSERVRPVTIPLPPWEETTHEAAAADNRHWDADDDDNEPEGT